MLSKKSIIYFLIASTSIMFGACIIPQIKNKVIFYEYPNYQGMSLTFYEGDTRQYLPSGWTKYFIFFFHVE